MPPIDEIHNQFSWSKSLDEIFQTCPRQFYFICYAYWGGWERDTPWRTRQIHILKRMSGRKVLGAQIRLK